MAPPTTQQQSDKEDRLYAISGQLQALNERSSEANRRLGVIEKQLDARVAEAARLAVLEQSMAGLSSDLEDLKVNFERVQEKKDGWWTWAIQLVGQTIVAAVILWGLQKLGIGAP
jgi:predicted  nucleic acid-binding Zn-ribbon protein